MVSGAELVAYWRREGVIGSRPDIADSQAHARAARARAERRTAQPSCREPSGEIEDQGTPSRPAP